MVSLARSKWIGLYFLAVVLAPLITACDTPWDNSALPLQTATPGTVVPPTSIPPPTPTFPSNSSVLSRTLEGVTISVAPLHADAHRVVLALRIDGPARPYRRALEVGWGVTSSDPVPNLSVDGKDLPWLESGSITGVIAAAGEPVHGQGTLLFDASKLTISGTKDGTTQSLALQLSLPVYENNQPPEEYWPPKPADTGITGAAETPTQVPAASLPASRMLPFKFTFEVPFDGERIVLQPAQSIEHNGLKITLERVDITASEALVTVHYSASGPDISAAG
jgi:hypothetical protein